MTSSPAYTNVGAPTSDEAFAMQLSFDLKRIYDDENLARAIELNDEEATLLRVKNNSRQEADALELERVKEGSLGLDPETDRSGSCQFSAVASDVHGDASRHAEVRAAEAAVDGGAATPESSSIVRQGRRRRRGRRRGRGRGRRRDRAVAAAAAGPKRCNVGLQQVLVFSRMPLGCDPWAQVYDVTP